MLAPETFGILSFGLYGILFYKENTTCINILLVVAIVAIVICINRDYDAETPVLGHENRENGVSSMKTQIEEPQEEQKKANDASYNHVDYTNHGRQKKLDEFTFRKPPSETRDSRKKLLDSMYQELVDSNVKRDPYLREPKENCKSTRGHLKANPVYDTW